MTNHIAPHRGDPVETLIRSLAPVGGKRRPVKVVEHPAFRGRPRPGRPVALLAEPVVALPLRVVSLNRVLPAAACDCRPLAPTMEAA